MNCSLFQKRIREIEAGYGGWRDLENLLGHGKHCTACQRTNPVAIAQLKTVAKLRRVTMKEPPERFWEEQVADIRTAIAGNPSRSFSWEFLRWALPTAAIALLLFFVVIKPFHLKESDPELTEIEEPLLDPSWYNLSNPQIDGLREEILLANLSPSESEVYATEYLPMDTLESEVDFSDSDIDSFLQEMKGVRL